MAERVIEQCRDNTGGYRRQEGDVSAYCGAAHYCNAFRISGSRHLIQEFPGSSLNFLVQEIFSRFRSRSKPFFGFNRDHLHFYDLIQAWRHP